MKVVPFLPAGIYPPAMHGILSKECIKEIFLWKRE